MTKNCPSDQQSHETIDEYVNKLRGLSETCEFGTLKRQFNKRPRSAGNEK